jgi:Arc/MetJ-type ribon-helix-helix transcriptional regulator
MTVRLSSALSDFVAANVGENGSYENASEYIRDLSGNDRGHEVSLCLIRQAIQFEQDDTVDFQPLTNDQLAEVTILCDQNSALAARNRSTS